MADVLALDEVDDVLGDVGGVVADVFEVFGDEDQFERGEDHAGIAHHVGKQSTENLVAVVVHAVVGGEDFLGALALRLPTPSSTTSCSDRRIPRLDPSSSGVISR